MCDDWQFLNFTSSSTLCIPHLRKLIRKPGCSILASAGDLLTPTPLWEPSCQPHYLTTVKTQASFLSSIFQVNLDLLGRPALLSPEISNISNQHFYTLLVNVWPHQFWHPNQILEEGFIYLWRMVTIVTKCCQLPNIGISYLGPWIRTVITKYPTSFTWEHHKLCG